MSIFRGSESAKLHDAQKEAERERRQNIKLAKPAIRALGQGPVAVVVMPGAEERRKALLAGINDTFPPNSVLQLRAARVQRVDPEGKHVDETLERLRTFRRRAEHVKGGSLVIFGGTKFPQPDTVDRIGRGEPEVVERVSSMIDSHGPNDPWFMFVGYGTPEDLPSNINFPRNLDRGILNAVGVTYALHAEHGLTTVLPSHGEGSFVDLSPPPGQRPLDFS